MFLSATLGWFGLLLQFYLLLTNETSGVSFWGRFFNFFSFFTILTNIGVAVSLSCPFLRPVSGLAHFFTKPATHSALAMYILIVSIVYITLLQGLWKPQGLQWLADIILHYAIPALYIVYWLVFVPKGYTKWKYCAYWLLYPAVYFVYSLIRGNLTGWYPYPFLDANQNGITNTLVNGAGLLGVFLIAGFIFIALDKFFARSAATAVKRA
jgi:hypothetical protein